jgi:uncharacterized Zn finger protein (UPF0148 family)
MIAVTAGAVGAVPSPVAVDGSPVGQHTGTVSCTVSDVTEAEVRTVKRTAVARLEELRAVNATGAKVDRSVLSSVQYHVEDGRLRLQNEEYCEAQRAFRTAREQASAELTRVYRVEAAAELNATARNVTDLRADGYRTIELYTLAERVERQRLRLSNVDSLADARAAHERATALRAEMTEVAPRWRVAVANFLVSPWVALGAFPLLLGSVVYGYVRAPTLTQKDDDDDDDDLAI